MRREPFVGRTYIEAMLHITGVCVQNRCQISSPLLPGPPASRKLPAKTLCITQRSRLIKQRDTRASKCLECCLLKKACFCEKGMAPTDLLSTTLCCHQ
mmetsp:Transcript_62196/g.113171  ORF Transcript_62196/g.113171 Transcript_62196/m.113171 type:complete len:98 (+) Transcript_62196:57-350(+)